MIEIPQVNLCIYYVIVYSGRVNVCGDNFTVIVFENSAVNSERNRHFLLRHKSPFRNIFKNAEPELKPKIAFLKGKVLVRWFAQRLLSKLLNSIVILTRHSLVSITFRQGEYTLKPRFFQN